jgi:hypothetical protein
MDLSDQNQALELRKYVLCRFHLKKKIRELKKDYREEQETQEMVRRKTHYRQVARALGFAKSSPNFLPIRLSG